MIDAGRRLAEQRSEVVADGVRQHEVAVGETLHQRRRTETVGAVITEVGLARAVQTGDGGHQLVVDPQPAHRVVAGRVDAHRHLGRVLAGDALVHLEQVRVALVHGVVADAVDSCGEVEVHAVLQRPDTTTRVDGALGCARRDVAGCEVAVARVQALEVVVAILFRDLVDRPLVVTVLRHPHTTVVAQRLAHQRQLRLRVVGLRDARRVDLRVARVGEVGAALVGPPRRGDVAVHRVGRQEEHVAVAAGGQDHRIAGVRLELAGHQIASDDAGATTVDDDGVDQLDAVEQANAAETDLAGELLIGAEQQLLAGLATCVERAADLGPAERTVVEQAAVLAGERNTLGDHLVDDVDADLGEAVHVAFARR